jgi:DNA-binding MarR family transcriptional regulator
MTGQVLSPQVSQAVGAWVRLLRAHASLRRSFEAQLQADHQLTLSDYEALLSLSQADGDHMRRVDLAERLQLTASGITRLLDGLERQGLVERATCPSDGRVTYAMLTEIGRRKLDEAGCSHVAAIRGVFEGRYTEAELATLTELLSRLPGAEIAEDCAP